MRSLKADQAGARKAEGVTPILDRREFGIYGNRFRWFEGSAPSDIGGWYIPLIRKLSPLAVNGVEWFDAGGSNKPRCGRMGAGFVYRFDGIADFWVAPGGSSVEAFFPRGADFRAIEFALSRGVLPRVLHLRGTTCLHASAVLLAGEAVAFCGASGSGKSTIAAALAARGCALVTDDVLPLPTTSSGILAGSGLPEIRIYPAAANRLGIADRAAPPRAGQTKAVWRPELIAAGANPLACVYLLEPDDGVPVSLQKASAQPALRSLLANSFWLHPGETATLAADLVCFARLVRSIPIYRFAFPIREMHDAAACILEARKALQ
jgi:hypothetical protein